MHGGLEHETLTQAVIGAAIEVHRQLGPGLLESAYEACLTHLLLKQGLSVQRQVECPVVFDGQRIDCGYRVDLIVNDTVIVELKAIEKLTPMHEAQLMTYLRLTGLPVGLLLNFNTIKLIDGLVRRVNTKAPSAALRELRG